MTDFDTNRFSAHRGADGWFAARASPEEFGADIPLGAACLAIRGDRTQALRSMRTRGVTIDLAYIDLPPVASLSCAKSGDDPIAMLCLIASSMTQECAPLMSPDGLVVVQTRGPEAGYVQSSLQRELGDAWQIRSIAWQKKYAPQNDLRGAIDEAHDWLFVLSRQQEEQSLTDFITWNHEYAGKTEDATRELVALQSAGHLRGEQPGARAAKPLTLFKRLVELLFKRPVELAFEGDPAKALCVLDVMSPTVGLTRFALRNRGTAFVLVGDAGDEDEEFKRLGKPLIKLETEDLVEISVSSVDAPASPEQCPRLPLSTDREHSRQGDEYFAPAYAASSQEQAFQSMVLKESDLNGLFALLPAYAGEASLVHFNHLFCSSDSCCHLLRELDIGAALSASNGLVTVAIPASKLGEARMVMDLVLGRDGVAGSAILVGGGPDGSSSSTGGVDAAQVVLFHWARQKVARPIGVHRPIEFLDDGDPRGPWAKTVQKGAGSGGENTAFDYHRPPYRWTVVDGELPSGSYQLNQYSGVIWGETAGLPGEFEFEVEVTDSEGRAARQWFRGVIRKSGSEDDIGAGTETVWWLDGIVNEPGDLRFLTPTEIPPLQEGREFRLILEAGGGSPYLSPDSKAPGKLLDGGTRTRYWSFSKASLQKLIRRDDIYFGVTGTAMPSQKRRKAENAPPSVELGWWDLPRLGERSVLERIVEIGGNIGPVAVLVGTSLPGRIATTDVGSVPQSLTLLSSSDLSELEFECPIPLEANAILTRFRASACTYLRIRSDPEGVVESKYGNALLWSQGFIPLDCAEWLSFGITFDKKACALVLNGHEWPTNKLRDRIEAELRPKFESVSVYHFAGKSLRSSSRGIKWVRVPFHLKSPWMA